VYVFTIILLVEEFGIALLPESNKASGRLSFSVAGDCAASRGGGTPAIDLQTLSSPVGAAVWIDRAHSRDPDRFDADPRAPVVRQMVRSER
jgi:hypothetical protein